MLEIMSAGRWKIVWDAAFQSARTTKLAERSEGKRDFDGCRILSDNFVVSCCFLTNDILDVSCRSLTYPDVSR